MYDTDRNGYIDKKEMERIIVAVFELVGETVKKNSLNAKKLVEDLFAKLDTDNDGLISEEEFVQGSLNDPCLSNIIDQNGKLNNF